MEKIFNVLDDKHFLDVCKFASQMTKALDKAELDLLTVKAVKELMVINILVTDKIEKS